MNFYYYIIYPLHLLKTIKILVEQYNRQYRLTTNSYVLYIPSNGRNVFV